VEKIDLEGGKEFGEYKETSDKYVLLEFYEELFVKVMKCEDKLMVIAGLWRRDDYVEEYCVGEIVKK